MPDAHEYIRSDQPVQTAREDELGRAAFAATITDEIAAWSGKESLVIGVQGRWGTGKSTLKHLIQEQLEGRNPPPPPRRWLTGIARWWSRRIPRWMKRRSKTVPGRWLTLSFTPWEWPDPGTVHQTFYSELGKVLGRRNVSEQHKNAATRLKRYAEVFSVKELTESGRALGVSAVALLAALGITFEVVKESLWAQVLAWLAIGAGTVILLSLGFKLVATIRTGFAEKYRLSAAEEHAALTRVMSDLPRPIVVFIDEIDRLNGQELRSLFSLLKLNANLPNLVFVLFYDASVVEKELTQVTQGSPRAYLEKVIQLPFTIPAIDDELLAEYVLERTDHIFSSPAARARYGLRDDASILFDLFRPFIRDLRHAKRFLASLSVHARIFEGVVYEVHPRDLFLLELLRVFEPAVHSRLAGSRAIAREHQGPPSTRPNPTAELRHLAELATNLQATEEVLKALFPRLGVIEGLAPLMPGQDDQGLYQEARVAHYDVFPRYFQFVIRDDQLSFSEMDRFFKAAVDRAAVVEQIAVFERDDRLWAFTKSLDDHKETLPVAVIPALVAGLLACAEKFKDDRANQFFSSPLARVERVLYRIFSRRLSTPAQRGELLEAALVGVTDVYLPIRLLHLLAGGQSRPRLITIDDEMKAMAGVLINIQRMADSGDLLSQPWLLHLLFRWRDADLGSEPGIRNWIRALAGQRATWAPLITRFITESEIAGRRRKEYSSEAHEHFLTKEEALAAWAQFRVTSPTDEETELLMILQQPDTDSFWNVTTVDHPND